MPVSKDGKKWQCFVRYTDWQGKQRRKHKRGFDKKADAEAWEREFLQKLKSDADIRFGTFVDMYFEDMSHRLKYHTIISKRYIFDLKILPYFEDRILSEITSADIRKWQNTLLEQNYSQTYLKSINNQMTALFNYAERYYRLKDNPCKRAGSIGRSDADEQLFWTKEEFDRFITAFDNRPEVRLMFEVLFWTGMRIGELMALTYNDIDFEKGELRISKSYQRLKGKDIITEPKTPGSVRVVTLPDFLTEELRDYCDHLYGIRANERIFRVTKALLTHQMIQGVEKSGVKKIRLHDLRHSHVALLIHEGYSLVEIGKRVGHVRISTTARYSHLYPDNQTELASHLNDLYESGDGKADTGAAEGPDDAGSDAANSVDAAAETAGSSEEVSDAGNT